MNLSQEEWKELHAERQELLECIERIKERLEEIETGFSAKIFAQ